MPTDEAIPFRTSRDVGEVITATFTYLRQNWRSLGLGLLYIVGPALAVQLIVSSFFQDRFLALQQMDEAADPGAVFTQFLGPALLLIPVSLLVAVLAVTVVYVHMRLYQQHGPGAVTVASVWAGVKGAFGKMLTTTLAAFFGGGAVFFVVIMVSGVMIGGLGAGVGPVGAGLGVLLMFLGFVCVGAYLLVFFALLFPVRMYEGVSLGAAFGRCRQLLRGAFWQSLGVVFVVVLLYYVLATAFTMPATILGVLWSLNSADGASALMRGALIAANAAGGIGSTAAYCIPLVAAALYYFGLVEEKEHAGLAARVERVGPGGVGENGPSASGERAGEEQAPAAEASSYAPPGREEEEETSGVTSEAPEEAEQREQARWQRREQDDA